MLDDQPTTAAIPPPLAHLEDLEIRARLLGRDLGRFRTGYQDLVRERERALADARDRYARTAADLLQQRNQAAAELEALRAERDGLRVELARALDRNRADLEVVGAAIAWRRGWATNVTRMSPGPIRTLIQAVDRLPPEPAAIAAERRDGEETDGVDLGPETGQADGPAVDGGPE